MRALNRVVSLFVLVLGLPAVAHAQASIAGTVKDTSGAVLPGVTVEASSPALIEKVRTVVTDDRPVPHRRSAARHVHRDVRAAGLQHGQARGHRADRLVHRHGERGAEGRRAWPRRSPSPASRRSSTCRTRREQRVHEQGGHRLDSGRPEPSEPGDPHPRPVHEHRHQRADPGRGRHQQHPAGERRSRSTAAARPTPTSCSDGMQVRNIGLVREPDEHVPRHGRHAGDDDRLRRRARRRRQRPASGSTTCRGKAATRSRVSFFATASRSDSRATTTREDLKSRGPDVAELRSRRPTTSTDRSAVRSCKDKLWFFGSLRRQVNQTYLAGTVLQPERRRPDQWTYEPDLSQPGDISTDAAARRQRARAPGRRRPETSSACRTTTRSRATSSATAPTTSPESAEQLQVRQEPDADHRSWTSPATSRLLLDARLATHGEVLYNAVYSGRPQRHRTGTLIAVTEQGGLDSRAALSRRRPGGRADVHLRGDVGAQHLASSRRR